MSAHIQLALLFIQVLLFGLIAIIGYYARKYIKRIDHNTRFRRFVAGDENFDDDGKLDQITNMHEDFEAKMQEVIESLKHVKEQNDEIIDAIEDIDGMQVDSPDARFEVNDD